MAPLETLEELKIELMTRFANEQFLASADEGMKQVLGLGNATLTALNFMSKCYALGREDGLKETQEFAEKTIKEVVRNSDKIADAISSLQSKP